MYGRTLGSVVLLAVFGAFVSRFAADSFGPPIDAVDQAGGALLGLVRGGVFATMAVIIVSTALTLGVIPVLYYMYLKAVGPENVVEVEV